MMAESELPSTEYSLWMMLNVSMRILRGRSTPGLVARGRLTPGLAARGRLTPGLAAWRSLVEQTGEDSLSHFVSIDRFCPLFENSLDLDRPVFMEVTRF
jgi:hypothetical protein